MYRVGPRPGTEYTLSVSSGAHCHTSAALLISALDSRQVLGVPEHRCGRRAILGASLGRLVQRQHAVWIVEGHAGGQGTLKGPSGSWHVKPGGRAGWEELEGRRKSHREALWRKRRKSLQKLRSEVPTPSCLVRVRRRRKGTLVSWTKNKKGELTGNGNARGKLLTSMLGMRSLRWW